MTQLPERPCGRAVDRPPRAQSRRGAVTYVGRSGVAAWLGVKPGTVTKYLERYPNTPQPDAYSSPDHKGALWLPEREAEWRAWASARPGRWQGQGLVYGRLLEVLNMIDAEPGITGPHIAQRLQIGLRTIRTDIQRLRDAGYPVKSNHGNVGGYQLQPCINVPPPDRNAIARAVSQLDSAENPPSRDPRPDITRYPAPAQGAKRFADK